MITDLPDLTSHKRKRASPDFTLPKRRQARISYPISHAGQLSRDVTYDAASHVIKNELKNVGKDLIYTGMQKTVAPEKQEIMMAELNKSEAIPTLLKKYLGGMENLPGPIQLGLLLAQKYGKVLLT